MARTWVHRTHTSANRIHGPRWLKCDKVKISYLYGEVSSSAACGWSVCVTLRLPIVLGSSSSIRSSHMHNSLSSLIRLSLIWIKYRKVVKKGFVEKVYSDSAKVFINFNSLNYLDLEFELDLELLRFRIWIWFSLKEIETIMFICGAQNWDNDSPTEEDLENFRSRALDPDAKMLLIDCFSVTNCSSVSHAPKASFWREERGIPFHRCPVRARSGEASDMVLAISCTALIYNL